MQSKPKFKDISIVDPTVLRWKESRGWNWENKYNMTRLNLEACYKSLAKYEKKQPALNMRAWNLACRWTERHYLPYQCNSQVVSLDIAEVECNKQTSNGYPISLKYRVKDDYMYDDEHNPNVEYRRIQEKYYDDIATEEGARTFCTASLKYELRSLLKIRENKIRTFTATSVTHNLAMSRLCFDMNQKFYSSHNKTFSCVGMTKYYGCWDAMIRDLLKFEYGWALDGKDFDSALFRLQLWAQMRMRYNFLAPAFRTVDNWNRLVHLYFDIIYTIMVTPSGDVIVKDTGNPSGQNCTIVDNTQGLTRLKFYAFIVIHEQLFSGDADRALEIERELEDYALIEDEIIELQDELNVIMDRGCSYRNFMAHVVAKMCGDDNDFTVAPQWLSWFNGRSVAEVWTSAGLVTTSDNWDPLPVLDLEFLSHKTKWFPEYGRYLPVPEYEKTMDSLLYASTSKDVKWSLLRAFALRMESWANEKSRAAIWDYITFVWSNYKSELSGYVNIPNGKGAISYENILNIFMSDDELVKLYCGFESALDQGVYEYLETLLEA